MKNEITKETLFLYLSEVIATEYASEIADVIYEYVRQDIEACADEDWNDDDLRLAVGRAICDKMGIEV